MQSLRGVVHLFGGLYLAQKHYTWRRAISKSSSVARRSGAERRGHEIVVTGDWENGKAMGIRYDKARGIILGGVSPRWQIGYALGW